MTTPQFNQADYQPLNNRAHPHPVASVIDLPVEPVSADVAMQALIRLEAKIDAVANQVNWITNTVTQFVEGIKSSPMAGMLTKRME